MFYGMAVRLRHKFQTTYGHRPEGELLLFCTEPGTSHCGFIDVVMFMQEKEYIFYSLKRDLRTTTTGSIYR